VHAGKQYSLREVAYWTRREAAVIVAVAALPSFIVAAGLPLPAVPWSPVALLGTAVAFLTGFRGNAAYNRMWEARQIWGGIVNTSRTWGALSRDLTSVSADEHRALIDRHIAWMTALRYQLREPRAWETNDSASNAEFRAHTYSVPEAELPLEQALAPHLADDELRDVLARKNRAAYLLSRQSLALRGHADRGQVTEVRHVELAGLIGQLYDHQGKCERIKNFPYPRQFATLNVYFVRMFIGLLPFGVASEFHRVLPDAPWLAVPVTAAIAWVFHTMDKIGVATENPFEGGPNDVPISAMARGIEVDLLDLVHEPHLPAPRSARGNILM
jgi:putative membrane protein